MPSTISILSTLALVAGLASQASAHMSIWHPSMYGVGEDWAYDAGDPVTPLGPGWTHQDDWWFRGPGYRNLPPQTGAVMDLPAGGSVTFEIACHVAWTSYGWSTTVPGSQLDACPGDNAGPYHSGDPNSMEIDTSLLSGCALGIADVDDISKVTMDNLAIFSVQHECIKQKETSFEIPARMPSCTGDKCICAWFWLANNGTANFYMTAFDCSVSGSPVDATPIAPPQDPQWCEYDSSLCVSGSKKPLYAYNTPSNVPYPPDFNNHRPGYHATWSFQDGAQNDIFLPAGYNTSALAASSPTSTSSAVYAGPTGVDGAQDLALSVSSATASSSAGGQGPYSAVDGLTGGYLADGTGVETSEWSSYGGVAGQWLNLQWASAVTFNQLILYDRPNLDDQVTSGNITFSDGSSVAFDTALPNDGLTGLYLNFSSPVTTTSLRFTITGVSSSTTNAGLSELFIYSVPSSGFTNTVTAVGGTPQATKTSAPVATSTSSSVQPSSSSMFQSSSTVSSPVVETSSIASSPAASSSAVETSTSAIETSSALPTSSVESSSSSSSFVEPSSTVAPTPTSSSEVLSSTVTPASSSAASSSESSAASSTSDLPASSSSSSSALPTTTEAPVSSTSTLVQTTSTPSSTQDAVASSSIPASSSSSSASVAPVVSSSSSSVAPVPSSSSSSVAPAPSSSSSSTAQESSTSKPVFYLAPTTTPVLATTTVVESSSSVPTSSSSALSSAVPSSATSSPLLSSSTLASTQQPTTTQKTTTTTPKATTTSASPSASVSASPVDLALQATATASSQYSTSPASAAIDGVVGGYITDNSGDETKEWSSYTETTGAWIRLDWPTAVSLNQVVLFDRPNTVDQVLAGNITFDGDVGVSFGELPNNARSGLTVNLATTVTTKSMRVYISKVSSGTQNAGFSEIQVYLANLSKVSSASKLTPTAAPVPKVTQAPTSSVKPTSTSASKATTTTKAGLIQWFLAPLLSTSTAKSAAPTTTHRVLLQTTSSAAPTTTSKSTVHFYLAEPTVAVVANPKAGKREKRQTQQPRHARDFRRDLDADGLFGGAWEQQ